MHSIPTNPYFLHVDPDHSTLCTTASDAGWICLPQTEAADLDAYQVGLVQVPAHAEVEALRRRFPLALLVSTTPAPAGQSVAGDFHVDPEQHAVLLPQILSPGARTVKSPN